MEKQTIKLQSSDGFIYKVDVKILKHSAVLQNELRICRTDLGKTVFPIKSNSIILRKIIAWLDHHKDHPLFDEKLDLTNDGVTEWDVEFLKPWNDNIYLLLDACFVYEIRGLNTLICKALAGVISRINPANIRTALQFARSYDTEKQSEKLVFKKKTIKLRSLEGIVIEVDVNVLNGANIIRQKIDSISAKELEKTIISIDANFSLLNKLIRWLDHHKYDGPVNEQTDNIQIDDISEWDAQFVKDLSWNTIYQLLDAAQILGITGLRIVICKELAGHMRYEKNADIHKSLRFPRAFENEELD